MRRTSPHRTKIRILAVSSLVLAVCNVLIWRSVLLDSAPAPAARESAAAPMRVKSPADPQPTAAPMPAARESVGVPVRIVIPSIGLDATIEKVALADDGSMDVPKQPFNTAWYELGPRPGEAGSAAIAGHVDWKNGAKAVFADLHKVKPGDRIELQDDNGEVISFVARESRRFDAAADAIDVFTSNDGKAHLNLITCAGAWDKRTRQYAERLVVFTDKVTK